MGKEYYALYWDPDLCRHCFGCIAVCPRKALGVDAAGNLSYEFRRCIRCFQCAADCQHGALQVVPVREE